MKGITGNQTVPPKMLSFKKIQTYLIVSGKTFYAKEAIKTLGGKWDPVMSHWLLPAHLDSEMLRKDLQEKATSIEKENKAKEKAKRKADRSGDPLAERQKILACLEEKKKTGAYHWICCENCVVLNWERQHTKCDACAVDYGLYKNSFRVRGMVYTGD